MSALVEIICKEFEKNVGRNQEPAFKKKDNADFFAMDLKFNLNPYYEKGEEGYRHLHIRIYGPMNYVAVLVKEDWTVIHESYQDPKAEDGLLPGKDYVEGNTGWMLASYHDSCWRTDGIHSILNAYEHRLSGIDSDFSNNWYVKKTLTEDERKEIEDLIHLRNNQDWSKHWEVKKIVGPINPETNSVI
jgi:hypothetical protein